MKTCTFYGVRLLCLLLVAILPVRQVGALEVPIRVNVNFILNASDNRPATGDLNTDAEVNAQVQRANEILAENDTEYKMTLTRCSGRMNSTICHRVGTTVPTAMRFATRPLQTRPHGIGERIASTCT